MQLPADAPRVEDDGEAAALFRGLLASANTLLVVADETGLVCHLGNRCSELIGRPPEAVVNRLTILDCVAKEDAHVAAAMLERALGDGYAEGTFGVIAADGRRRRMEATANGIETPDGARVLFVARDVSEIFETHERLGAIVDAQHAVWRTNTTADALRAALAIFRDRIELAGAIGAYLLKPGTRRLVMVASLGHPPELSEYVEHHSISVDVEDNHITRAFAGVGGIQVLRFADAPMDDRIRASLLAHGLHCSTAVPLESLSGEPFGVLVVGLTREVPTREDGSLDDPAIARWIEVLAQEVGAVADRMLAQERLKVALASERRFSEEFEAFAYRASHDLSEPLRRIGTLADFARQDLAQGRSQAAREELAQIAETSERVKSMISRLLELSRVSRSLPAAPSWQLADVARQVIDDLTLLCAERDARATLETPMPQVAANRERVYVALHNIVENAIIHNVANPRPHVWIRAETRPDGFVEVSVRDNGPGIPEEHRERVFHLFHRGHVTAERGRVGAGLTVAMRAITQEGGNIWILSSPEGGTDVRFTLRSEPAGA
ncbi:MAG TPA: PAS domain-containing sensor histidine kinase [Candidatus Thermoplasmatota archaeon]|nr:PAS domain-containing sensor histidine kinase [Candidatus Thermoplasmatota archaeon]